jgi:Domain of unknown function (DUF2017)
MRRRVRRTRKGDFELRLEPEERDLLRALPSQMREVLTGGTDPALARLFPVAYPDDPEEEAEYRALVGDELLTTRLAALDTLADSVDAERLDEEQLLAWMRAINDVRLLLGTRLEVTENLADHDVAPDDPRAPGLAVYHWLSWLQEQVVEALDG